MSEAMRTQESTLKYGITFGLANQIMEDAGYPINRNDGEK